MPKLHATLLKAAALLLALTTAVAAQDYPSKPVRLIIPFPPGGSNDVVGRLIATHLSDRLGKQVVVDNRGAGAGGVVGTEVAANAPHDGYTLLIISLAHAVNPWLYKLPYDPDQGVHADRHSCFRPERAGRQSRTSGAFGQGVAGGGQGQARPVAICLGRHRQLPAPRRRAVQAHGRRQHPACAVQGRRPGDDRRDRRAHQGDVQLAGADHAAHPIRQVARARNRRIDPQPGPAGRAHHRGGGRAGIRGGQLVGRRGAGGYACPTSSKSCTRTSRRCKTPTR